METEVETKPKRCSKTKLTLKLFVIKLCGQLLLLAKLPQKWPSLKYCYRTALTWPRRPFWLRPSQPCQFAVWGPVNALAEANRNKIAQAYPFLICNMSLAERQAKRTCHIDEAQRERERERARKLPENRVLYYYESTPSARFVAPFVVASFLAKNKISSRRKNMVKGKAKEKPPHTHRHS